MVHEETVEKLRVLKGGELIKLIEKLKEKTKLGLSRNS